jgi:two-component system sensor kinase FixL
VSGRITGVSKILRDLTDRDTRDGHIQKLQAELAHAQRLTELGQVVSTLVHEVNQPITAISNYVNACRRLVTSGKQDQIQAALERIASQTERAQEIVHRIREFVMKRGVQMRAENLSQVIEEAVALTRASVRGKRPTIAVQIAPTGSQVEIDKVQVQQVLFNLLRNAIEAMQEQLRRELSCRQFGWSGDGGDQRCRHRPWSPKRGSGESVSAIRHDQAEWHGRRSVGMPEYRGSSPRPVVGRR